MTLDVGIDLDGVCYDFTGALRRYLARDGRPLASMPPATRWAFYGDWGLSAAQFRAACDSAVDAGRMFWRGDVLPDTDWAWHALRAAGHRLHVITSRDFGSPGVAKQATRCWLDTHRLPYDSLTLTEDKTVVDVDVMVDDCPAHYDALDAAGRRPYLFTRPWNADYPGRRVGSWVEFVAVVQEMT